MKIILQNAWKLFTRDKGFFYVLTVQPIFVFLLMSFLLPYSTLHNVALIGEKDHDYEQVQNALENLGGVNLLEVSEEEVISKLANGNIEIAILLEEQQILSYGTSEVEEIVSLAVENALSQGDTSEMVTVNEAKEKGLNLTNSLGFMIYKTLSSGSALASLLIIERNNKMKERILLSGTSVTSYLGGLSLVYTFFMMISSAVYYVTAIILNFDFGMRNSLGFLLMMFVTNILSTALFVWVAVLFNKEEALWFMATFVLTPMGLFSGVLFPYEFMPRFMQTIGSFFPQRWISRGIETMQESGSILSATPDITLTLGLSLVFFVLAAQKSKLITK
ncbi:MAG: ABC transporter permease [Eubacteriales bacterium]